MKFYADGPCEHVSALTGENERMTIYSEFKKKLHLLPENATDKYHSLKHITINSLDRHSN